MIDLYYWPTPNGWKITIALEEMGLPYRLHLVDIGKGDQFDPEFLKIAPNNRMPAIVDPEGPGGAVSIFESGAILLYLARKSGKFGGDDARSQIAVEQWLMWQMGGVGPMAGQAHHFISYAPQMDPPQDLPYAKDRYRREVARLYGVLERQLERTPFVAGAELTIADMAIWPWVILWERQEQTMDDKPHVKRWLDTLAARPGFIRGKAVAEDMRNAPRDQARAQELLFGVKRGG